MATAGPWAQLAPVIHDEIIATLSKLGYPNMTPCQAAGVSPIVQHQDVAVDAETGSGKTLSFLVPIAQLLLYAPNTRSRRPCPSVRALVIVPTRELASQVHAVATALFTELPGDIAPVPLIGGESAKHGAGPLPQHASDTRLVIATPGRLNAALNSSAVDCRKLEVLIMDEADRLLDMGFSVALTAILTRLPKQRRTGLYSATQTEQVEELARAGLRNPVRVTVRVKAPRPRAQSAERESATSDATKQVVAPVLRQVTPATLSCFYAVLRHEHKLHHFAHLLTSRPDKKFIVYLLTCSCVDYFARLPFQKLMRASHEFHHDLPVGCKDDDDHDAHRRTVVALHGKMSQAKRTRALDIFAKSSNGLLICTDVAARGLDIPDVDWIVQFDPPQDPDAYVHRVGRTARLGREGNSLIYLAPHEDAYADFLSVRRCPVRPFVWPSDNEGEKGERLGAGSGGENSKDDVSSEDDGKNDRGGDGLEKVQNVVRPREEDEEEGSGKRGVCPAVTLCTEFAALQRELILSDRAVLDVAEKAFLSYLRAYKEHRCTYLLPFNSLDLGSVARSFALVRLPRFQEFKRYRGKMDFEADKSIRVKDIKYKDKARERKRQEDIQDAVENRKERRDALKAKSKKNPKKRRKPTKLTSQVLVEAAVESCRKGGRDDDDEADMDELNAEARMLKKVRRGKLSKKELDEQTGYAFDTGGSNDSMESSDVD